LKVDFRKAKNGIHVFVTGIRDAVPDATERKLKTLVRNDSDPNVIRYQLAIANREAARSPKSLNGIGGACLTYSLDVHGGGHSELHGDVAGPVVPRTVGSGIDISKVLAAIPGLKGTPTIVQSAFVTSESNAATLKERIDCKLEFNPASGAAGSGERATVEDIGAINEYHVSLHGLERGGRFVGQLRTPPSALPQAFVVSDSTIIGLGTFGGPFSNAFAINARGQAVGAAHLNETASHAFVWSESEGLLDLGTLGGRDSTARAINDNGQVVGDSFIGSGDPKHENQRTFLWTESHEMINLGPQVDGWSRAVGINAQGAVLVSRLFNGVYGAAVWSPEFGTINIPGQKGKPFYPCAINDSGLVVGEGEDPSGRRRAFSWTHDVGLKQLNVPDDFRPSDVDEAGNILGNLNSKPWNRPFLYRSVAGGGFRLPFAENHNTSVKSISDAGMVIGAASTGSWKHSHPLVWRLNFNSI
jgi:probable HAF family extracellular repeat protein